MIFVGGFPRTCTSVIMECLKNSGYGLGPKWHLHGHKYKSEYRPFNMTLSWILDGKRNLNQFEYAILHNLSTYAMVSGVEALKCFNFCFVGNLLKDHEIMKDPKIILTYRDLDEAIESSERLKDYGHTKQMFKKYLDAWEELASDYPHIKLEHGDVIYKTEEIRKQLSEFLGREIDMSIVSPKETYAVSGKVH